MKQLKIYKTALSSNNSVGWMRDDIPGGHVYVVHVFAQAEPGKRFKPSNGHDGPHWPCEVCELHGYTEEDFHKQMTELMEVFN